MINLGYQETDQQRGCCKFCATGLWSGQICSYPHAPWYGGGEINLAYKVSATSLGA